MEAMEGTSSPSASPSPSTAERSVGAGLLEEGLLSLGFVLLVVALLGGLMLVERRTFARAFALDDRRRERERVMWEEDDVDEDQDDSSSVDDHTDDDDDERYIFEGADTVVTSSIYNDHRRGRQAVEGRVTWQTRLLSINGEEDGRGGELSSANHSRAGSIASVTSDDGDDGDEASFAMHRLNRVISAATKSVSTRHH